MSASAELPPSSQPIGIYPPLSGTSGLLQLWGCFDAFTPLGGVVNECTERGVDAFSGTEFIRVVPQEVLGSGQANPSIPSGVEVLGTELVSGVSVRAEITDEEMDSDLEGVSGWLCGAGYRLYGVKVGGWPNWTHDSLYEEPRREDGFIVGSNQQSKACNEHARQRARERCYMSHDVAYPECHKCGEPMPNILFNWDRCSQAVNLDRAAHATQCPKHPDQLAFSYAFT